MPWDPNTGALAGVNAANQGYIQTMLEGLREKSETHKAELENYAYADPSKLEPEARAFGEMQPDGRLKFHKSNVPVAAAANEKAITRKNALAEQGALATSIDALHPPTGTPMPQELRGPYSMLRSGVPAHPDAIKAAVDYMAGKKNLTTLKPGEKAFNSATKQAEFENMPDQSGPPGPAELGHTWRQSVDQQGLSKWEHVPMNAQQLYLASQQEKDPVRRALLTQAADYAKLVPLQEGGNLAGGATAVSGGGRNPIMASGPPKPPGEQEIKTAQGADSVLSGIDQVESLMNHPDVARFRGQGNGIGDTLKARAGQKVESLTNLPVMSDAARSAAAALSNTQAEYRKMMYGVRITQAETNLLQPALAASINDPALPQKLADLRRIMMNHRAEVDALGGATNRAALPPRQQPGNTGRAGSIPPVTIKPPAAGVSGAPSFADWKKGQGKP